jgi:hypothetical protein
MQVPFTAHRVSGAGGLIRVGVLCGGVRFGIDVYVGGGGGGGWKFEYSFFCVFCTA